MKKQGFAILLIILGLIFFLSHPIFSLTGFTIKEDFTQVSVQFMGLVMVLVGVFLFLIHYNSNYSSVASEVYNILGHEDAYGHHTKDISNITHHLSNKGIPPKVVEKVIRKEIEGGRLRAGKGESVSISQKNIGSVLDEFGPRIDENVKERLDDLGRGNPPQGYR